MNDNTRLLLVEDERTLAGIIADTLSDKGFVVEVAHNGAEGLEAASRFRPDIIVTDIMMPTMDGFTFVKRLRAEGISSAPVLFLSARSGAEDVVKGFRLGAEDYIRKPFAMSELLVRIESLLARHRQVGIQGNGPVSLGSLSFDPESGNLTYSDGRTVTLPTREARLLEMLCAHLGETVPNALILKQLWNDDDYFATRSLNVHITRLRKHLSPDPSITITSLRGIGYRLSITSDTSRR